MIHPVSGRFEVPASDRLSCRSTWQELRIVRAGSGRLRPCDDEHSASVGLVAIPPVHPPSPCQPCA